MIKDKNALNILVVEDNKGDFILIEDFLLEHFASPAITHALNFKQAASVIHSKKLNFDVILLDLTLTDNSGEQLIAAILDLAGGCPVIILTGHTDLGFSIQSISQGISDYLVKDDLNATTLYKSIIYCIERKKSTVQLQESEKRYSELFHLSPQPMWVYNPETFRFVQVNKSAIELYGYSEEEFLNMTILDIRPEEDSILVKESLKKHGDGGGIFRGKFRHLKKNGELIDVDIFSNFINIQNFNYRLVIAIDVTEETQIEHTITRAIIKTQEDERYEIGAELHDNVCQILASTQLNLSMLKDCLDSSGIDAFNRCMENITLATQEIRSLSHRLAPAFFNDTVLNVAFESLIKNFNVDGKYKIKLHFDKCFNKSQISRDLQLNLYRILQEQLKNISKYSKATVIEIRVMMFENKLEMRTTDNGVGFHPGRVREGIGLANMKRRAELFSGIFDITSSPGKGCEISIMIPMQAEHQNDLQPLFR